MQYVKSCFVFFKLVYIISLLCYFNQINFDMLLQNVADKVAIKNVGWFSRILANIKIAKIKLLCLILHLLFYLNLCLELPRGHWTVNYSGTQSFIIKLSHKLAKNLGVL